MADIFLKIPGVDGESQDEKHKDEMQIDSYHVGGTQPVFGHQGTGLGAGKAMVHDMQLTKHHCKASAMLFISMLNGKHFPEATLTVRKAGEFPLDYLIIKMEDVIVSSHNSKSDPAGGVGTEHFALHFSTIEFTYVPQNKDGSAGAKIVKKHDIVKNKSS